MKKLMVLSFVFMAVGAFATTPVHVEKSPSGAFSMAAVRTNLNNVIDLALTNELDIAANTADIVTNTADILTNTANIATNTANIATNTAHIAAVSNLASTAAQNIASGSGVAIGSNTAADTGAAIGWYSTTEEGGALGQEATSTSGGAIGRGADAGTGGAVGQWSSTTAGGAVGYLCTSTSGGAIGLSTSTTDGGSVGRQAVSTVGFSGGYRAQSAVDSVQLGTGTNTVAKSLQIYGYQLMDGSGNVPIARLTPNLNAIYATFAQGALADTAVQDLNASDDITSIDDYEVQISGNTVSITPLDALTLSSDTYVSFGNTPVYAPADPVSGTGVGDRDFNDARYFNNDGTETNINLVGFSMSISNGYLVVETTP